MFSNGSTSYAGSLTTAFGLHAPVSSQKACTTGNSASAARLSLTITISGAEAVRCRNGIRRDLAVGTRPDRRIRPAEEIDSPLRCLRYAAACWNPVLFSTSARTSRTNGRITLSILTRLLWEPLPGRLAQQPGEERHSAVSRQHSAHEVAIPQRLTWQVDKFNIIGGSKSHLS